MTDIKLTSAKSSTAGVFGSSTVVHRVRCKLGITYEQYVVIAFLDEWRDEDRGMILPEHLHATLAMKPFEFKEVLLQLQELKLVVKSKGVWNVTEKWLKCFIYEADFREFWKAWGRKGNRPTALANYKRCRRKASREEILAGAKRTVADNDNVKFLPKAEKWLDPKAMHWKDHSTSGKANLPSKTSGNFLETSD